MTTANEMTANKAKANLRSLLDKVNKATGKEHANLSEGVETLVLGYGVDKTEVFDGVIELEGEFEPGEPEITDYYEAGVASAEPKFVKRLAENFATAETILPYVPTADESIEDFLSAIKELCERANLGYVLYPIKDSLSYGEISYLAKTLELVEGGYCGPSAFDGPLLYRVILPENFTVKDDLYGEVLEIYDLSGQWTIEDFEARSTTVYNLYSPYAGESKLKKDENGFIWYVDDDNCFLCDYRGKSKAIALPESYNGREYKIFGNALKCLSVESIYIPKGVKNFEGYIFEENKLNYKVKIVVDSVDEWFEKNFEVRGSNPFALGNCELHCGGEAAVYVVAPAGCKSIGQYQFYNYKGLKSITLPEGVLSIEQYAFLDCTGLKVIDVPGSVTSIGSNAFYGCTGLEEIDIPGSVTSIGSNAFYGCTGLKVIDIPDSVTNIGSNAFYGCTGLKKINIQNGVTNIGDSAFSGCTGLEEFTLPKSISNLGSSVLGYCTGLKRLVHYGNKISSYMCAMCTQLTDVTINDDITVISSYPFANCVALTNVTVNGSIKISNSYLRFDNSPELTVESMVNIMNAFVKNTGLSYTVYFGTTNLNKLTAEQKAVATNKNIKLA